MVVRRLDRILRTETQVIEGCFKSRLSGHFVATYSTSKNENGGQNRDLKCVKPWIILHFECLGVVSTDAHKASGHHTIEKMAKVINTGYKGRCLELVKARVKVFSFSKNYAATFTDVEIEHDGFVWHAALIWWDTPGSVGMITRVIQNVALKLFTTRRTLLEYIFHEFILLE